ncbi:MAG: glutathione S-transferase family protein [Steroidobacteraceae bacterium]
MIDVYWGADSPYCWRVLLALELKGLAWRSHLLATDLQEQKSPQMLAINPRGRLPVLRDNDYIVFESLAVLYYLEQKYPARPLFGRSPEEAGVIMRVINEFQAYIETDLMRLIGELQAPAPLQVSAASTRAMHTVAREARTIEARLSKGDWIVGDQVSAADVAIYPCIRLLHRALLRPGAQELASRFLPAEVHYPQLAQWLRRMEELPGYERTLPPGWHKLAS